MQETRTLRALRYTHGPPAAAPPWPTCCASPAAMSWMARCVMSALMRPSSSAHARCSSVAGTGNAAYTGRHEQGAQFTQQRLRGACIHMSGPAGLCQEHGGGGPGTWALGCVFFNWQSAHGRTHQGAWAVPARSPPSPVPAHLQRRQDCHCVLPCRQVYKHVVQRRAQRGGFAAQHISIVCHQHRGGAKGARLVHLAALHLVWQQRGGGWCGWEQLTGVCHMAARRGVWTGEAKDRRGMAGAAGHLAKSQPLQQPSGATAPASPQPAPTTATHIQHPRQHPQAQHPPGWASCARRRMRTASPLAWSAAGRRPG